MGLNFAVFSILGNSLTLLTLMACREKKMQREGCWSLSDTIQVASIRLWNVEKRKEEERRKLWREREKRADCFFNFRYCFVVCN